MSLAWLACATMVCVEGLAKSGIIFLGAGIGANARFWIGTWIQLMAGGSWPWGTFAVNVSGSLAIGLVLGCLQQAGSGNPWRLLLVVGLLGGYTTFSSFSYETVALIQNRMLQQAMLYVVFSCALSFAGTVLGLWLARVAFRT